MPSNKTTKELVYTLCPAEKLKSGIFLMRVFILLTPHLPTLVPVDLANATAAPQPVPRNAMCAATPAINLN